MFSAKFNRKIKKEEASAAENRTESCPMQKNSRIKKGKGSGIVIIIVALLAVFVGIIWYFINDSYQFPKDMESMARNYEEKKYERALKYYEDVIELGGADAEEYLELAELYLRKDAYEDAAGVLKKGIENLQEAKNSLIDILAEIYRTEAADYLAQGNYAEARNALDRGTADTGRAFFAEQKIQTYRQESDGYLAEGKCQAAVEILMEGVSETGAAELSERENYLRENIVLVRDCFYSGEKLQSVHEYDIYGNELKYAGYDRNGSINYWYESEYDAVGNHTKEKEVSYVDGEMRSWREWKYDAAGNKTKETSYNGDGTIYYWYEYEYNIAGNLISMKGFNGVGTIMFWTEYDLSGNKTKHVTYESDGSIMQRDEYEYDAFGNKTKEVCYKGDGSIDREGRYKYDAAGNLIEASFESGGSIDYRCEYEYDASGNVIEGVKFETERYRLVKK